MKSTLRQLEVFVAATQQENVSHAVKGLSLSQSATSTSLGELKRQFDCKLFDCVGKRLILNVLDRQLLPQAVMLLDRGKEIGNLFNGKTAFSSLDPGAILTIGSYLVTLLVGASTQRQPGCWVRLYVHDTVQAVQQVTRYKLDLGLIEDDCRHPDIGVQPWTEDELVVLCTPQHPLARRGDADLERLAREAWILHEQGLGTRLTFDQAMRHHPQPLSIRLELEHIEAIRRVTESDLGIGCISRLALRGAFHRGSLVLMETPDLDLCRQFYFIWHKQKYQTATMREFLDLCRSEIAGISRNGEIVLSLIP